MNSHWIVSESSSSWTVAFCSLEARLLRALLLKRPKNESPDTDVGMLRWLSTEGDDRRGRRRRAEATTTHARQVRPHNANTPLVVAQRSLAGRPTAVVTAPPLFVSPLSTACAVVPPPPPLCSHRRPSIPNALSAFFAAILGETRNARITIITTILFDGGRCTSCVSAYGKVNFFTHFILTMPYDRLLRICRPD